MSLETPWVEKYRPMDWAGIVSQNIAINNLKKFVESGDMPHMIFTGPAGTGKTSTALIIARKTIKEENFYRSLLELNASDTVRMAYVRESLKAFVNQNLIADGTIKIVILDEADNIPTQVQQALRRIIEKASSNIKFILMCNYINRIIDPIISRCAVFRFVTLPKEKIVERLKFIAKRENLLIPREKAEKFYDTLFFISGGDLRKAINTLQMAVALELLENLDIDEIFRISGFVEKSTMERIIETFNEKNFINLVEIINSIDHFDSRNFIRQISNILPKLKIPLEKQKDIYSFLGEVDYRISQGADQNIQIISLVSEIFANCK